MTTSHTWNFFRAGGFDQVQLDSGADLLALKELDQKLWVALGCPTRGLEFDTRTLDLIDSDADGHVRANEVLAAIDWAGRLLKNADLLVEGTDSLALADIDDSGAEGKQVLVSVPSMAMAWFKLKRRNLAPILDANGWAINARARINIPFGTLLTGMAELPEGANRSLVDPFAEKQVLWPYYLAIAAGIVALTGLWYAGFFGHG